jgi:putative transposase
LISTPGPCYLGSTPHQALARYRIKSIMEIEYHKLYTHFILITQNRRPSILPSNRERVEKYITGIVNNNSSKLYSIYANPEHAHLLVSRSPRISDELLATIIADNSARFINENDLSRGKFAWQQSAAALSVSKSDVDRVCKYILNQPQHHRKVTFDEEYARFIREYQKTLRWEIR